MVSQVSTGGALVIDAPTAIIENNKTIAVDNDTGDTLQEVTLDIDTEVHIPEGVDETPLAMQDTSMGEESDMDTSVDKGNIQDNVDTSDVPEHTGDSPRERDSLSVNTSSVSTSISSLPASTSGTPVVSVSEQGTTVINVGPADSVQLTTEGEEVAEGKQAKSVDISKPSRVKGLVLSNATTVIPVEPAEPIEPIEQGEPEEQEEPEEPEEPLEPIKIVEPRKSKKSTPSKAKPPRLILPKKDPEEDPSTTSLYGKNL